MRKQLPDDYPLDKLREAIGDVLGWGMTGGEIYAFLLSPDHVYFSDDLLARLDPRLPAVIRAAHAAGLAAGRNAVLPVDGLYVIACLSALENSLEITDMHGRTFLCTKINDIVRIQRGAVIEGDLYHPGTCFDATGRVQGPIVYPGVYATNNARFTLKYLKEQFGDWEVQRNRMLTLGYRPPEAFDHIVANRHKQVSALPVTGITFE